MKLKFDENGNAVLEDGNPVYIYDDGSEAALDAKATLDTLNNKVKNLEEEKERHFKNAKKAKKKLEGFKDVNIEKYNEAMEKFKAIEDKKLVDEQGVEALKKQMTEIFDEEKAGIHKSYREKLKEGEEAVKDLNSIIYDLAITNKFATNKYFSGKSPVTIYPPNDAAKIFGSNFKVEVDGRNFKVVAMDNNGKPILSKKDHGNPADFDEAIGFLVEAHAKKNAILRSGKTGGPVTSGNIDPETGDDIDGKTSVQKIKAGLIKRHAQR